MTMQVLELLAEDIFLIGDAISEDVWEDSSLFGLELVSLGRYFFIKFLLMVFNSLSFL